MTDHVFTGLVETAYPFAKDAHGLNIGLVEPGEIRDTDGPVDHQWSEATDEDRERWAAIVAARENPAAAEEASGEAEPGSSETPESGTEGDAGEPDGPQPAQPAVIPGT